MVGEGLKLEPSLGEELTSGGLFQPPGKEWKEEKWGPSVLLLCLRSEVGSWGRASPGGCQRKKPAPEAAVSQPHSFQHEDLQASWEKSCFPSSFNPGDRITGVRYVPLHQSDPRGGRKPGEKGAGGIPFLAGGCGLPG